MNKRDVIRIEKLRYRKWSKRQDGGEVVAITADIYAVNTVEKWVLVSVKANADVCELGCFTNCKTFYKAYQRARSNIGLIV